MSTKQNILKVINTSKPGFSEKKTKEQIEKEEL